MICCKGGSNTSYFLFVQKWTMLLAPFHLTTSHVHHHEHQVQVKRKRGPGSCGYRRGQKTPEHSPSCPISSITFSTFSLRIFPSLWLHQKLNGQTGHTIASKVCIFKSNSIQEKMFSPLCLENKVLCCLHN